MSLCIGFGKLDVAGLPAIRAIVQAIDRQAYVVLRLAETAVFFAGTLRLRLVALRAQRNQIAPFLSLPLLAVTL